MAQLDTLIGYIKELAAGRAGRHRTDRQLLEDFESHRDELAFAGLVQRHGAMVLRVCRRVLRHEQDAEDAFQATFLVLARNPGSIRRREALASWLYGVAYRTAMKAKRSAARRRKHEGRLRNQTPRAEPSQTWDDVQVVLDEEIQRLPESFRSAFVLCVLDGKTEPAAAAELGIKLGTLSWRLAQARQRLRQRLARRGIQLSAVSAALSLPHGACEAAVPAALGKAAIRFGLLVAAGEPAAGAIPSHIAALAAGATRAMFLTKTKVAVAVLLAAGIVSAACGLGRSSLSNDEAKASPGKPPSPQATAPHPNPPTNIKPPSAPEPTTKSQAAETVEFHGRVLDPEGKPRGGTQLQLLGEGTGPAFLGASGPDGRFTVQVPRNAAQGSFPGHFLVARAAGTGLDFVQLNGRDPARRLELRLVKDHVLRGRVIDTEGKPVAGAHVAATRADVFDANSVDSFLAAWRNRMISFSLPHGDRILWQSGDIVAATTGIDGRFTLAGTGAERVVLLKVSGAGLATLDARVVNRAGLDPTSCNEAARIRLPIIVSGSDRAVPPLYGPDVVFVVEPGKIIRGVVREEGTAKPWPGVEIHVPGVQSATTDAAGRYEIRGLSKAGSYTLWVKSDLAAGLLRRHVQVSDTIGYAPVRADITVPRITQTATITGRILNSSTGKAIRGEVHLGILADNAFAKAHPELDYLPSVSTAADGTFRIVTIPGPILLMGGVDHEWSASGQLIGCTKYKPATPDARYPRYFPADHSGSYTTPSGFRVLQGNFCKVLKIEPGTKVKQDIIVEPAPRITLKIRDAQGHPLRGTFLDENGSLVDGPTRIESDSWQVATSDNLRQLVFYERKQKLFGLLLLKGGEKGPVEVRLRPCGAVRGRVVDQSGKPIVGINVNLTYCQEGESGMGIHWGMHAFVHGADLVLTDSDGKFAIDQIIPGVNFHLWHQPAKRGKFWQGLPKHVKVKSGQTTDLGDLRLAPAR